MIAYNLTYQQNRAADGQYNYCLEPYATLCTAVVSVAAFVKIVPNVIYNVFGGTLNPTLRVSFMQLLQFLQV